MPFWRKSEDPWDQKPEKRRPIIQEAPEEPKKNPLEALNDWREKRRAAEAEQAAPNLPPEKCPWCGQDMEQGYIIVDRDIVYGGRGDLRWYPGRPTAKTAQSGRKDTKGLNVLNELEFIPHKTVWLCRVCMKMVFDMPKPHMPRPFPETKEQEESGEE